MKTVIVTFMLLVFAVLVYNIFSPLFRADDVAKRAPDKKAATRKKPAEEKEKKSVVSEMITTIKEKVIRREAEQPSLAESMARIGVTQGDPVFIRIFKEEAELELWISKDGAFHLAQTYPICAYSGTLGPKLREGDRQSPEGFYTVTKGRLNPNSRFHLSFNLGYPNRYDRAHGRTGSFLMVHGDCVSVGCYAMTDSKIEEIYEMVEQALYHGQKGVGVHIFPFRMTETNMQRHAGEKWVEFWRNLKEGYDHFEQTYLPPRVGVKGKKYTFY